MQGPLGRNLPIDNRHVELYPLRAIAPETPMKVEVLLPDPTADMVSFMNQGNLGSCVGWSWTWAMAYIHAVDGVMPRYDAVWLYNQAQLLDDNPNTPPDEGTTVRAGGDVLRNEGAMPILDGKDGVADPADGIAADRWATTIDEVRTGFSMGLPVVFGIDWLSNFDTPKEKNGEMWIGEGRLGSVRGGHAICATACSDERQAIRLQNSWGPQYGHNGQVWLPYKIVEKLLKENAEAALITKR